MFLAIEGCIAAGKSTTARLIAQRLGWTFLLEETEFHSFLSDFYTDPERYALETELEFVLLHYHQLHHFGSALRFITDFSPVKDLVFAKMNLSGEDLDVFERLYQSLVRRLEKPTVTVYLDVPIEELMRRVHVRGRPYELTIPKAYVQNLACFYEKHLAELGQEVRSVKVAAGVPPDQVADEVLKVLKAFLDV